MQSFLRTADQSMTRNQGKCNFCLEKDFFIWIIRKFSKLPCPTPLAKPKPRDGDFCRNNKPPFPLSSEQAASASPAHLRGMVNSAGSARAVHESPAGWPSATEMLLALVATMLIRLYRLFTQIKIK